MTTKQHQSSPSQRFRGSDSKSALFFGGWARVVCRYRWFFLVLTLAYTGVCAWLAVTRLTVDFGVESFAESNDPSREILKQYRRDFGNDEFFLVLAEGDVFSEAYLSRLQALHADLEEIKFDDGRELAKDAGADETLDEIGAEELDGWDEPDSDLLIEEVMSLINIRETRQLGDGIEVAEFLKPFPDKLDVAALGERVRAHPGWLGQVLNAAGTHSVLTVRTVLLSDADKTRVSAKVHKIMLRHQRDDFKLMVAGFPELHVGLNRLMLGDLKNMFFISMALMVGVLFWLFRHPIAIVGPISVVIFSCVNALGFMALFGLPMTMVTTILPAFFSCVGLGDSVHLLSLYRENLKGGSPSRQALTDALAATGQPIAFTTLTTMFGLLSFKFASLHVIQHMGIVGAFGVFCAMMHSLVLLPIILTFAGAHLQTVGEKRHDDWIDRFLLWCQELSCDPATDPQALEETRSTPRGITRRRRTLLTGLGLSVLAIVGAFIVDIAHDPISWIPADDPVRQGFEAIDAAMGGTATVAIIASGQDGKTMRDRDILVGLDRLTDHIRSYRDPDEGYLVGAAMGITDVVKETNQALNGGDVTYYRIPQTDRGAADMLFLFENAGYDELRRLATIDLGSAQMLYRIKWLNAVAYEPLGKHIEEGMAQFIPPGYEARATGSIYTLLTTVGALLFDLLKSFGFALFAISVLMTVLLRSFKFGLIAMAPNLLPIVMTMGAMGFADLPLDMNTILFGSIAMGVAVDDTIHFLYHFRSAYRVTGCVDRAIYLSLKYCGRAMIGTTVVLLVGFSTYLAADMANVVRFGLLVSLACFLALLIDLILAPALLRVFYADVESQS